jgi:hypothetical protein
MNFQLFLSAKDVVKPWRRAAIKYFIKGTGMGILVVEGVLFGMILGQFFKFFILFPACGFAIVLVLTNAQMEDNLLSSFVQIVALITSLQIGYVVGLVARDFCLSHKRSKNLGVRSLDETSSGGSESRERSKRAA